MWFDQPERPIGRELQTPCKHLALVAVIAVVTVIDTVAHAQTDQRKSNPYSQGVKVGEKFSPYQQGTKAGNKFSLYSQGANKNDGTASVFSPGAQPIDVEKGKYGTYTQDAKASNKFDSYNQSVKAGSKLDPYSEGANKEDVPEQ